LRLYRRPDDNESTREDSNLLPESRGKDMQEKDVRETIRQRIREKGTISDAAEKTGVSRGYISEYLNGAEVSTKTLKQLADYCGLEIETVVKIKDKDHDGLNADDTEPAKPKTSGTAVIDK
jgi:transcriptional regulator with XRE-family HTH domain